MSKAILTAAGAGVLAALAFLSLPLTGALGAVIFMYLAPLPLFMAGLGLGLPAAVLAGLAGTLATALLSGGLVAALLFVLVYALPVVVFTRHALLARRGDDGRPEWYPPGWLLLWLTGYAVSGVLIAVAMLAGTEGGAQGAMERAFADALAAMPPALASGWQGGDMTGLARLAPGMVAASWLLMMVINAALAQGAVAQFGHALRPGVRMADIELPEWAALAFVGATLAAAAIGGTVGLIAVSAAMVLGLTFVFAGLAVVHAVLRGRPAKPIVLALVYVSFLLSWPVLFVAGLGIVEQWTGWRRRALAGADRED
jgi:hypothetical protein